MIGDEGLHPLTKASRVQSFRNFIPKRDLTRYINEHPIACATGQQFARGRPGRFRTTRWSVVLLSARIAAEGRLVHEHGAPTHLPELR
jgi:hypothetical protein